MQHISKIDIKASIEKAKRLKSNLDNERIRTLDGLSSPKVWHLLNNIVGQAKTYLEVGLYKGSTLIAAIHGNNVDAYGVDNFSMFPNKRQNFYDNTAGYKFKMFEMNSWDVPVSGLPPIEVFFYDGDHSFEAQYKAIEYYLPAMADEFIYICDDWNLKKIPNATFTAGENLGLQVIENYDLFSAPKGDWWNGIGIVKFKKQSNA